MSLLEHLRGPLEPAAALLLEQGAGLMILDNAGRLVRTNAVLRDMAGLGVSCLPGALAVTLFDPADRPLIERTFQATRESAAAPPAFPARLARAGTTSLPVELVTTPLREGDGTISGLVISMRDMSPRRALEAQLAHGQKLQAVGQLAAGIAHDFNNLLTAILGAAETIEARAAHPDSVRDAAEIRGSAERGAALVRQLLAFGRQQTLQPRVIRVNDAISALAGLLGRLLGSAITLTLDLDPGGGAANVDPTQLDQVLINLACNGRDAMPQGGVLTLRSGHITLFRPLVRGPETIPPGRYVMVEVQDTGSGIPPEVLPRIFDPFFTTRRERGGTGLGLSTVHGIIRQSSGFLGVESEPGRGTRVRVYLPRCQPVETPPAITQPPAAGLVPASRLVLLVDDEDAVRRLGAHALGAAGWRVLAASSGQAALDMLEGQMLDLLITDIVMPGIDGAALARQLRHRWPSLPVLLVTGYADESLRARLADAASDLLLKPYRLTDLVARAAALGGSAPACQVNEGSSAPPPLAQP